MSLVAPSYHFLLLAGLQNSETFYDSQKAVALHLTLIGLSCGFLLVSFFLSIALILGDARIKRGALPFGRLRWIPSIQKLDLWNTGSFSVGFVLLLLAMGTGFFGAEGRYPEIASHGLKLAAACFAFFVYLVLLVVKFTFGWRGRRAAWLSIFGFIVMAVTMCLAILG